MYLCGWSEILPALLTDTADSLVWLSLALSLRRPCDHGWLQVGSIEVQASTVCMITEAM